MMKTLIKNSVGFPVGKYVMAAALVFAMGGMARADDPVTDGTWKSGKGTGLWSNADNWEEGDIANGAGSVANFTTGTGGFISAQFDGDSRTIGIINYGGTSAWGLAALSGKTGTLIFDNNGSDAQINVSGSQSGTANNTIYSQITTLLQSNLIITNNHSVSALNFIGKISGAYSLTKNGIGTLTLSNGGNDFSGGFVLNAGNVRAASNSFGSGTLTLHGGGLETTGGYLSFANPVDIKGNVNLAAGNGEGSTNFTGAITLYGNYALTVDKESGLRGVIGDGGNGYGITKKGLGNLILEKDNTYSGEFVLKEGSVSLAGAQGINGQFGTGTLVLEGGSISTTTTRKISNATRVDGDADLNSGASPISYIGKWTLTGDRTLTVSNAGVGLGVDRSDWSVVNEITESEGSHSSLTKEGSGALALGIISYTGGTILNEGSLTLRNYSQSNSSGDFTVNAGTLEIGSQSNLAGKITLNNGTISSSNNNGSLSSSSGFDVRSGTVSGVFAGTGDLVKTTSGTVTFTDRTQAYTGATSIQAGTLIVASGSINTTSGISITGGKLKYDSTSALTRNLTVNGGTWAYNSANNYSGTLTFTSGVLAGTNWNGNLDNLEIGTNQAINPGNSPGTAVTGSQTWAGGGSYIWEINDAEGAAGSDPGWDLVSGSGSLTITADASDKFTIQIVSLKLDNTTGDAENFHAGSDYAWKIADFASDITLDLDAFLVDDSAFTNTYAGIFGLALGGDLGVGDNTQVWVTYSAIPEPSTVLLIGLAALGLVVFGRRKIRKAVG